MKLLKILTIIFIIYQIFTSYTMARINFGTLSIIDSSILAQRMVPATVYLSNSLHDKICLKLGRDYKEIMDKLVKGDLDIGFIGPAPYVKIKEHVELVATLASLGSPFFNSVIVIRKDSDIKTLSGLAGKKFAFGSPHSTLSFYVPAHILHTHNVLSRLEDYNFLGKHDRVAKNVILGRYDAGGVKESVYFQYRNYLNPTTILIDMHQVPEASFFYVIDRHDDYGFGSKRSVQAGSQRFGASSAKRHQ